MGFINHLYLLCIEIKVLRMHIRMICSLKILVNVFNYLLRGLIVDA